MSGQVSEEAVDAVLAGYGELMGSEEAYRPEIRRTLERALPVLRAQFREELLAGLYVNEGDDPGPLQAAVASVEWTNGAPALDEMQHAIGTWLAALPSTDQEGSS